MKTKFRMSRAEARAWVELARAARKLRQIQQREKARMAQTPGGREAARG
jgi:hypothetical protein